MIQNDKIAARERLVGASPKLMRWLKRPLVTTLTAWRILVETEKRNRLILKKMKYRMDNGCVISTFAGWNEYVDVAVKVRFEVLKAAVADALRSGTMIGLIASLKREQRSFQRQNVRWDEFARAYMTDALAEFSAEESGEVGRIYKQVVARREKRERERMARLKQFQFGPGQQQQSGSPSPPQRRGMAESLSPPKERLASPARARQIAPGYMSKTLAKGNGVQERREGGHHGAELRGRERGEREAREREKRRTMLVAKKAREEAEHEGGGRGGSAPLPPRAGTKAITGHAAQVRLPRIEAKGGDGDWPWADKRAVSFALGEREEFAGLPKLVQQKAPVIL